MQFPFWHRAEVYPLLTGPDSQPPVKYMPLEHAQWRLVLLYRLPGPDLPLDGS